TVNIGAITPFSYGIYTATFTDNQGCISNKQIEIVPQNTLNMSYSVNDGQTVANKIIQACLNDKISLSCYTTNGTSIWLTPSGNILHGNELNTIKIESMTENDYGTYYVKHTNDDGCGATYNMTIISNAQTDIAYSINQADFKYSNTNIISTNIGNSIQISLMGNISNAIWQGTTSNFNTIGSTNKSITIDYINEEHFGTYQVHFIDNNGCQAKQNIAIVSNNSIVQKNNEIPNKSYQQIKISPNPISSNQKLNLAFYTETESEKHFSIFDIHGKLQQQQKFLLQKGINELQIDITHLSKGVFIIADKQGNKTKFIVL
ncbi:MAG: T9SS type A sorting domain-containing protein, partial [Chitinophagales bacterium]